MNNFTPVRNLQTALRKISDYNPSLPSVIPDGIFGNQTETAVREFQKEYGLDETGIVDFNTHNLIYEIYGNLLKNEQAPLCVTVADIYSLPLLKNSRSPVILILQAMLQAMSLNNNAFLPVEIDGVFGDATENAVKKIQRISGLPETGAVNKDTWDAIAVLYPGK